MKKIICLLFLTHFIYGEISFSPIEQLAHPGVIYHDMATDSKGNCHAIWVRKNQNELILETASKCLERQWESAVFFSNILVENAHIPAMIVDSLDNVHIVWVEDDEVHYSLKTAMRSSSGKWAAPKVITSGYNLFLEPRLAKNSFGSVFAIWRKQNNNKISIIQSSEREKNSNWSNPVNLTKYNYYRYIDIGADDLKNVYATWTTLDEEGFCVQTSQKSQGSRWSLPSDFDYPGRLWGYYKKRGMQTKISVNALGNAFAISKSIKDSVFQSVRCSERSIESDWSTSKSISGDISEAKAIFSPNIIVDNLGNAFSSWFSYNGYKHVVEVASYSKIKKWSTPQSIIQSVEPILDCKLDVDHLGNAALVWSAKKGANFVTQASFFSKNQGWSSPLDVSLEGGAIKKNIKVTMDKMERAHISWIEGAKMQAVIKVVSAKLD